MEEKDGNQLNINAQNSSAQNHLYHADSLVNLQGIPTQSQSSNNLLDMATGGSSSLTDEEVPTGTPREERLARKLKAIDVLSPKSSIDIENTDNSTCISAGCATRDQVSFSGPLHSPILAATSLSSVSVRQEMFEDKPIVMRQNDALTGTIPRTVQQNQLSSSQNSPFRQNMHSQTLPTRVNLLVGGTRFVVNPNMFTKYPNTMLGRMFSSSNEYWRRADLEKHEIAQDIAANVFKIILEFYKCGSMYCPPSVNVSELREACDYFLIPFNATTVTCQNLCELLHELSNDGAKERFKNQFVENVILPKLIDCAEQGNRECHLVILKDDDVVEWGEFPPNTGEEYADIVYCTPLYQFFKYFENRDVAKDVLVERGLKKVKLGIEGYPTHMEKVKYKQHGKPDVIYSYIQRPFIHMSWEKEGSKSRHVDFQCVKPKHSVHGAVDEPAALSGDDLPPPVELLQAADQFEPQENNEERTDNPS